MTSNYIGAKYFGLNDLSNTWQLERAETVILSHKGKEIASSINEAIEIYNVQKIINAGIYLQSWDDKRIAELKEMAKPYIKICANYFSTLTDDNLVENYNKLWFQYADDFWTLFDCFKIYKQISSGTVADLLQESENTLSLILKFRNVVAAYDSTIAEYIRKSQSAVPILIDHFWGDEQDIRYLPKTLHSNEYDILFQKYIMWEGANLNYLKILSIAQSMKECPISDKTKLIAKKKFERYWETRRTSGVNISFGVGVQLTNAPHIAQIKQEAQNPLVIYDIEWLEDNLDYPTVLNNFIYVFEQIDIFWRSKLPSIKSEQSDLEAALTHSRKKEYQTGVAFRAKHMLYTSQTKIYYDFLREHGIRMEDVLKWYFMEYLPSEFDITGFLFNPPSEGTTWLEKCRSVSSEMDGILKQYRMFQEDGFIDRELLEISSTPVNVSTLSSFINDKYAYAASTEISQELYLLFSDQSCLSYTERTKDKYSTLYQLMASMDDVEATDFVQFQENKINWLKRRGTIYADKSGCLHLNKTRCSLLKDLYEHDVLCLRYCGSARKTADELIRAGDLRCSSTLFSEPEQDYYNFILNKSKFDNGMDLRNKYIHSTYPTDEKTQERDYFELLKVMIMILAKINEECIIREEMKQEL